MNDELRPEYDLSQLLKDGIRGKYAEQYQVGTHTVAYISSPRLVHPEQAVDFNKKSLRNYLAKMRHNCEH